jgi:hypothetical protein
MLNNLFKRIKFSDYAYLLLFPLYIPLTFLGFGTDSDTYTALNAWKYFLTTHDYVPSRLPGYVIHEMGIYYATKIGDSLLSNLISLLFAALLCLFLIKILKHYSIPASAILLVILNPVFIVNSTSTVDYIWAMCFFVIGFYLLIKEKIIWACLAIAFSSAIRLSYAFLILAVFINFFLYFLREKKKSVGVFFLGGILILIINFAAYYLPIDFTEWKLSVFFTASLGNNAMWSPIMRISRWGYKNVLFWGVPSVFFVLVLLFIKSKKLVSLLKSDFKMIALISAILILIVEAIFLKYPIEIEYLFPILPFMAMIFGILYNKKQWILVLLSTLILINGFFSISIARPDVPNHSTGAIFELAPTQGYLLSDISNRQSFEEKFHNTKNWWYAERIERLQRK